jgi:hypothetical protein
MNKIRYSKYTLPNGRNVFLTQRPDSVEDQDSVYQFIVLNDVAMRFQYTDDLVDFPEVVPSKWFPWFLDQGLRIESVYASTVTLQLFNKILPIEKSLWLHCDSSSMRAPTYFGLFLHCVYPDKVEEVTKTLEVSDNFDYNYALHSTPDKYAGYSLKKDEGVKELVEWYQKDEKYAYRFLMGHDMTIMGND